MQAVVEESVKQPALVDFWAPWCGPCKTLGPALEEAVKAQRGKVALAKVDIDKNPMVAGQLRVQSIPAVFAFVDGRPVDGFMGALPPGQVKQFVERLEDVRGLDLRDVEVLVENAEVTLNGTVRRKEDKRRIEDIADLDGVRHVQNNLRVREGLRRWF